MKRFTALLVCVVLLAGVSVTQAQIIVPQPGVFTDPNWLKVDYHRVTVDIEDQIATTHVDMQFTNQGEALAEGTFIFPLPLGATVDQLTMWVDGQPIDAKVLPATKRAPSTTRSSASTAIRRCWNTSATTSSRPTCSRFRRAINAASRFGTRRCWKSITASSTSPTR
jgi:hypothetical protein